MKHLNFSLSLVLGIVLLGNVATISAQEDVLSQLTDIKSWVQWSDASTLLQKQLNNEAYQYLHERKEQITTLESADEWQQRQQQVKQTLIDILGPFPNRTPLNAKVTGVLEKEGYRVEKILFESMPEFYVTGCLFIPDELDTKAPAVLNPIGHTDISFRASYYQQVILNLVNKGFIVFAIDPLGQGERLQYWDAEQEKSLVGGSTAEHSHFGRQNFLNGVSSARYFVWDGIRAIDYLLTRDEVDPKRIAVTGLSGGGTQTAYISAVDDRVAVSAPAGYITSFTRLLQSIGPQDAEQNFIGGIAAGLDHADLIEVRAPKPTLLISTTRDFFSIQGSRETYQEAKQAFAALGKEQNLQMVEDDYSHGYTKQLREGLYAFLQKHFNMPGDSTDEEVEFLTEEELTITDTGQVLSALDSKTVYDYNKIETEKNLNNLEQARSNLPLTLSKIKADAKQLSGYQKPNQTVKAIYIGGVQREGYRIEKFVLPAAGPCVIPYLLLIPEVENPAPALIFLNPLGKEQDATPGGFLETLVKQGYIVAAADLSGLGEVGNSVTGIKAAYSALLINRSIPAIHAAEIVALAQQLQTHPKVDAKQIGLLAQSTYTPAALHAAAFNSSISSVALVKPLMSYASIATSHLYTTPEWIEVPGALLGYDLPDLAACIAPRKLLILSPTDSSLKRLNENDMNTTYHGTTGSYQNHEAIEHLKLVTEEDDLAIQETLINWFKSE